MKILAFISEHATIKKFLDHRNNNPAQPRAPPHTSSLWPTPPHANAHHSSVSNQEYAPLELLPHPFASYTRYRWR